MQTVFQYCNRALLPILLDLLPNNPCERAMSGVERQNEPAAMAVQQHLLICRIGLLPRLSDPQQPCLDPVNAYVLHGWLVAAAQLRLQLEPCHVRVDRGSHLRLRLSRVGAAEHGTDHCRVDLDWLRRQGRRGVDAGRYGLLDSCPDLLLSVMGIREGSGWGEHTGIRNCQRPAELLGDREGNRRVGLERRHGEL